ncbi:sensor histidine kinase [Helicobacter cynogastricus]|uniref:sensor histidine kinase n=1 Tax=Helicobacter cynogastricus TaxID=329937 RepID=UPI000CF0BFE4|nr:HAMP domain-containing sensor histidine kinase [Helicobacter cynogastricus]
MRLGTYEKQSLRRFLTLYLGSFFALMVAIALLFFIHEKNALLENIQLQMQLQVNHLAQDIVLEHMEDTPNPFKRLAHKYVNLAFVLLDTHNRILYRHNLLGGTSFVFFGHPKNLPLFLQKDEDFYLVDNKAFGHLGVATIILQRPKPANLFTALYRSILLVLLGVFVCVGLMAYFLTKLFLKPINDEIKRLDRFSKDIAHELNTPIATLLISAKELARHNPKALGILVSTRRIFYLHNQLSYLFMQDLRHEQPGLIDLQNLVAQQISAFCDMANFYQIQLTQHLQPTIFKALEEDMITLVSNLLMNAIKYTPPKGYVHVSLDGALSVSNTGPLLNSALIAHLSARYVRGTQTQKGYGIGLDLVKNICVRYGLELEINTQEKCNVFKINFSQLQGA